MGILGIRNRTENWKTVEHFHCLGDDAKIRIAQKLGEPEDTPPEKINIELFWYGMRDYIDQLGNENQPPPTHQDLAERYRCWFPNLRKDIKEFDGFRDLNDANYDVSKPEREYTLRRNLIHTEIDIVLETQDHLFIGQAKHESGFGVDGKDVLVHQLIRQYVMAKILVDLTRSDKQVISFVVGDDTDKMNKYVQVKFMLDQRRRYKDQGWLRKGNVLSWGKIKEL